MIMMMMIIYNTTADAATTATDTVSTIANSINSECLPTAIHL
jgi:hypothetical protein